MLLYYLLLVNIITFVVYGLDKRKARRKEWRISENALLSLAIIGGSPAALLAMSVFKHKTKKNKFRLGIPIILILQIAAIIYFLNLITKH